jgi:hypothetical protein
MLGLANMVKYVYARGVEVGDLLWCGSLWECFFLTLWMLLLDDCREPFSLLYQLP